MSKATELADALGHRMKPFVKHRIPGLAKGQIAITAVAHCQKCIKFAFARKNQLPTEEPMGGPATKYPCMPRRRIRMRKAKTHETN